jgi:inner membrane protease ATP23
MSKDPETAPPAVVKSPSEKSPARTKCEEMLRKVLSDSHIDFVRTKMADLGCDTSEDKTKNPTFDFLCTPCGELGETSMAFFTHSREDNTKKVVLCEERFEADAKHKITSTKEVRRTVLHELIHAYDHCRADIEEDSCEHMACSEVRAALLSGDCNFMTELKRRNVGFSGQGMACVKRRAQLSVEGKPACREKAKETVDKVFDRCFKDTAPFFMKF